MATKAHLEGNKRYLSKFDDIKVRVPKGDRDKIKAFAEANGETLNSFIVRLIQEAMDK